MFTVCGNSDKLTNILHFNEHSASVVTKAVDAETETKTEAAGFETEAKTEAVYLKTEAEAQGSWPISLTVLSSGAVLAQKFWGALLPSSFVILSPFSET